MTVSYRFFENGDFYSQENFADFVRTLLTDGYVPNIGSGLSVSAASPADMTVEVGTGMAYVHGYIVEVENDAVSLTIDTADETNPRIDRVVARMSATSNRNITFAVLKGTPAATPTAPALTQTEETWEIALAQVAVAAGVVVITAADITDERVPCYNMGVGLPNASSTVKGLVQTGTGITVNNGVISVMGVSRLSVDSVTDTNNGWWKVGEIYTTYHTATGSVATKTYTTVIDNYMPTISYAKYNNIDADISVFTPIMPSLSGLSITWRTSSGAGAVRVLRNGDTSTILKEVTNITSASTTFTVSLPSDWDFSVDYITVQTRGTSSSYTTTCTINTTTVSKIVYMNPTLEEVT